MNRVFLFFIIIFFSFIFFPYYERDVVLYHAAVSKYWFYNNFQTPNFSHYFYYPWLSFVANLMAIYVSPFFANFLHFVFLLFTVYLISNSLKSKLTSHFFSLLFITLQPSLRFSYVAYADFYLTFFSFSALMLAMGAYNLNFNIENRRLNFLLSAIMCGLGLNTKYNMLVFAMLLYFFIFWISYHSFGDFKKASLDALSYFLVSFAMFFPFLLKNYLLTGSSLYPFLTDIFPNTNPFAFKNVSHFAFRKYFFGENLLQILATPIIVFFYGVENNIQYFDGVLNPFFAIFPIIAVFAMKDKLITALFLFGWLYNYFVLFLEPVSARFLLPSVPIFAYISGQYLSSLKLSDKKLWLLFLPFLLFNLYFGGKHIVDEDKWQYLFGKISKDEFLERKCPDYKSIKFINENTPENAKVFYLFSGQRTYYLERSFIYDSFNDGRLFKRIFEGSKNENEFREKIRDYEITHFFIRKDLFEQFLADNFNEKELEILNNFFKKYAKLIFQDGVFLVVEIKI